MAAHHRHSRHLPFLAPSHAHCNRSKLENKSIQTMITRGQARCMVLTDLYVHSFKIVRILIAAVAVKTEIV